MTPAQLINPGGESADSTCLFEAIATDLLHKGYSINPGGLPPLLADYLLQHLQSMPAYKFDEGGIGRQQQHALNKFVRSDEICWIDSESDANRDWLRWSANLQTYLNSAWQPDEGGEMVIYGDQLGPAGIKVTPAFGTVVAFLSEEFPHEVLPATRDRYSIAGWYRLNTSTAGRVDPPD